VSRIGKIKVLAVRPLQIESGKRNGTFKKLAAIAKARSVPVDILAQQ